MKHAIAFYLSAIMFAPFIVNADPIQDAEQTYSFNSSSTYQQLLTALGQAYPDFKANPENPTAMIAMNQIYAYVASDKKIQLNYDYLLQQSDVAAKKAAVQGINTYIDSGLSASPSVNQAIANKLWQDLASLQSNSDDAKAFARGGVNTLLLLLDDRGLEAILTDKAYIKNLQATDQWNDESPTATFAALKQKYDALIGLQPGARELAAIYELCRLRKVAGVPRIETTASVIDLANF
jgi:hypothetical protein